ncbi:FAD-dependent oxidoreductase [Nocardia sp. NPDC005366]|uniref:FAD-dependent oxidoreductase n=1 Tax=Nocardia sp. NPDC005366 TaxID=3156878 RepID=UPI00339F0FF3
MSGTQVLVVGGGPVGLAIALGLARQGVEVTVLDADTEIGRAPRAMVHHPPVVVSLGQLGVLDDALSAGRTLSGLGHYIWETEETISNRFDHLPPDFGLPQGLSLGQDALTEILLRHLMAEPTANVLLGHRIVGLGQDGSGVTATVRTDSGEKRFTATWLVGADGAHSGVRDMLGLSFDGMTWPDHFVATNVRADFDALGLEDANFSIHPEYGGVIARIGSTGLWRFTYRESPELPIQSYEDRIDTFYRAFFRDNDVRYEVVAHSPYRIHQRSAPTYRVDRVLLAGDAAHITNPMGGFGLMAGLLDAACLSEALGHVVRGLAEERVLTRYADERRRAFFEVTSPASTAQKQFIFDERPLSMRKRELDALRRAAVTGSAQARFLLTTFAFVTPSVLVNGQEQYT